MRSPYQLRFPQGRLLPGELTLPVSSRVPWIGLAFRVSARWSTWAFPSDPRRSFPCPTEFFPPLSRLTVRGSPHAHAVRILPGGDDSPSRAASTSLHLSHPGLPCRTGGSLRRFPCVGPLVSAGSALGGMCLTPVSGHGPPLALGPRRSQPRIRAWLRLGVPVMCRSVVVLVVCDSPAARRPCAARPGYGSCLSALPTPPWAWAVHGFSVAKRWGLRPAHGGRWGYTALCAAPVCPLRAVLGPSGVLFWRVVRGSWIMGGAAVLGVLGPSWGRPYAAPLGLSCSRLGQPTPPPS